MRWTLDQRLIWVIATRMKTAASRKTKMPMELDTKGCLEVMFLAQDAQGSNTEGLPLVSAIDAVLCSEEMRELW